MELIVVSAVTAFLAVSLIVYSSSSRSEIALTVESAKIGQFISRAKSLAVSTGASATPLCGYGVSLNYPLRSYSLFRYASLARGDCDLIGTAADPSINAARITILETLTLDTNVNFRAGGQRLGYVLFVSPDPDTRLWADGSSGVTSGVLPVPLVGRSGGRVKLVDISSSGQISF